MLYIILLGALFTGAVLHKEYEHVTTHQELVTQYCKDIASETEFDECVKKEYKIVPYTKEDEVKYGQD